MNCTRWDILSKLAFLSVLLEIITNTYPIRNLTNDTERKKIWHNSELFVEINLRKDDPNHSRTTLFVQVCAMNHTYVLKKGHILAQRSYFES